jgi:hypothetical protein
VTTPSAKADGFLKKPSTLTTASVPTLARATLATQGPVRARERASGQDRSLSTHWRVQVVSLLCGTTFTNDPVSFNPAKSYLKEPHSVLQRVAI